MQNIDTALELRKSAYVKKPKNIIYYLRLCIKQITKNTDSSRSRNCAYNIYEFAYSNNQIVDFSVVNDADEIKKYMEKH